LVAAGQARALAQQASAAADARQLHAARARESRGDVALTQLHYGEAAGLFGSAASLLTAGSSADRGRLLSRQADALYRQGSEFGDNTALLDSITIWQEISEQDYPRTKAPLDWAIAQNNLGTALWTLGERESGTARLEEAVAAYHAALEERTRERVPLDWAMTQMNLGNALVVLGGREKGTEQLAAAVAAYRASLEERTRERVPLAWAMTQDNLGTALLVLGERETGTTHLEEAANAYRSALEERTRGRVPLEWAMTQVNLGAALEALGERESGTAHLEEAVAALDACLAATASDCPPDVIQFARARRDETEAEIRQRSAK
jgi:tetratricopeptide (TPR) repeat protein